MINKIKEKYSKIVSHKWVKGPTFQLVVLAFLVTTLVGFVNNVQLRTFFRSRAAVETVNLYISPPQTPLTTDTYLDLMLNAKTNQMSFVKVELTYDPSVINLVSLTRSDLFKREIVTSPSVSDANTAGKITLIVGVDPNDLPPTGVLTLARMQFKVATSLQNMTTAVSFDNSKIQLVDIRRNVLPFTTSPGSLTVNPVTATPTLASATGIVPSVTIKPTLAPSPRPTATPAPAGPLPTLPVSGTDYLIINKADLMVLPTTGAAWDVLKSAADSSKGIPDLCNQDNRTHPKEALAAALVYARQGNQAYADKAKRAILAAIQTMPVNQECPDDGGQKKTNGALSLGRQLGAYVIAADLIKMNDPAFNTWLRDIRTSKVGTHGRWPDIRTTSINSASNWGTFALASIIAADRFLGDSAMVDQDWKVFSGYGKAFGWPFQKTASWNESWSCVPINTSNTDALPIGINTPCIKSGVDIDGAGVEDASRTTFPTIANYPAESAQGYVVQALLLSRAGYDGWGVNDQQVKRNALFRQRLGNLNKYDSDYYVNWMINKIYGLKQDTKPAGYGRVFGFTDWLFPPDNPS